LNSVQGDPSDYRERLEQFIQQQGIALEYSADIAPARGTSPGGKITILPGQSPAETVETLAHEIAHELMHRGDRRTATTKRPRETEAEAVAYLVANATGPQATSASADYLTLWNGDAALLGQSLEIIQRTAVQIITATSERADPQMNGKQLLWPETMWRRYGKPTVKKAKIEKRVGFHTFRHTYATLLTQNNEDVMVVQELLRHANSRVTLDLYAQAGMSEKREAQHKIVEMVLGKGKAVA
jgi:hypothetical protein